MQRWRSRLETALEWSVIVLMTSLAALVIVAVIFRKTGGALVWYDEIASVLLAWLTYYGASLAALKQAHIGFPRLVLGASPRMFRVLVWARAVAVVVFFLLAAWAGIRVLTVLGGNHLVSLVWIPTRLTQSVIPIGSVLFIVAELLVLAERLRENDRGRAT